MQRVCLVGAGYISGVHAEILAGLGGIVLSSVVDPNTGAARRLADRWRIADVYSSIEDALAAGKIDRAHVVVPPDRHLDATLPLLRAGKPVLLEKPLGVSRAQCDALVAAAAPAVLGVNQNFVFHPAFLRLRAELEKRRYGKPRFADIIYNVPLRQMESRQFGHWMFRAPLNILLEQAVHPLSQLLALFGPVGDIRALAGSSVEIAPDVEFVPAFTATLSCRDVPANLYFAVGQSFPAWQLRVVCDDGVLTADMIGNRFWRAGRTRWLEAADGFVSGSKSGIDIAADSSKNLVHYGMSVLRLRKRSDGFFSSMHASLRTFHAALDRGLRPPLDGEFGRELVDVCERLFVAARGLAGDARPRHPRATATSTPPEFAVLGGTGFIGRALIAQLASAGRSATVLARNTANLPAEFESDLVRLHRGDVRNETDVAGAIAGASIVINLAHGGGGDSWEAIRSAMVGGAECVARACQSAGAKRLIHVGSIAGLYLGPQCAAVTGATPPDPHPERRADYARAKALCDLLLLRLHEEQNLPVCILRPGLVVGGGTSPFHTGLGFFNNEQHCIGWNRGRNALPFVLVDDVAAAILAAADAPGIEGRCYNLVGDVRLSAREYLEELAAALQRPLKFHPKLPAALYMEELGKWSLKRAGGRRAPFPSRRDIESRGLRATFDCRDAKRELGWSPVCERALFVERAIAVHAQIP